MATMLIKISMELSALDNSAQLPGVSGVAEAAGAKGTNVSIPFLLNVVIVAQGNVMVIMIFDNI